jgi:hypothetical protein
LQQRHLLQRLRRAVVARFTSAEKFVLGRLRQYMAYRGMRCASSLSNLSVQLSVCFCPKPHRVPSSTPD